MISYYGGEYLVNFERYAQVLSQNFNVRIYLDGTRAETHEDSSIHLPNIKNISEQGIDCLYGILLHEIGHVKFSKMRGPEIKKMKGRDHFSIWNGVEDARIENKLISRLEGANDIFERLYGVHFKQLGEKIFGLKPSNEADPWHLFCVHAHDYLLRTKRKAYHIDDYPEKIKTEVLELFAKAKPIIDAHKFSTPGDSFSLANKLFKEFGPKRPEFLNEFKGVVSDVEKCKRELREIHDAYKNNPELTELKAKKKALAAKKKALEKVAEKNNSKKSLDNQKKADDAANMLKYLNHMAEVQSIDEGVQRLRQEQTDRIAKIEALKSELAQGQA